MIVNGLKTQLLNVFVPGADPHNSWAKFVTEIDFGRESGYMYVGRFIKWALLLRDEIVTLMARLAGMEANPLAAYDDLALLGELGRRGYSMTKIDLPDDPESPMLDNVRELRRYLQQLSILP